MRRYKLRKRGFMPQNDFTFAPRGQQPIQQPVQPQPVYQQPYPNMAPQQQQPYYQQPVQNGYYPQMQVAQPNDGSREFMEAYNKNVREYQALNQKIKSGPTKADAESNLEKMEAMVETIQADVAEKHADSVHKAETLGELADMLTTVINAMEAPEVWLPKERQNLAPRFKDSKLTKSLVPYLTSYRDTIQRLG